MSGESVSDGGRRPSVVGAPRRAAVLVGLQGGLLVLTGLYVALAILRSDEDDLANAVAEVVVAIALGILLLALGHLLSRGVRAVRSPVVVVQLLALPVAWSLLSAGRYVIGAVLLVLAVPVLVMLLRAPAEASS